MSEFLSINETMVDLRSRTKSDIDFIESHKSFNMVGHEFECILGTFSYRHHLSERVANEVNWITFKNYIAGDFINLKYPPCHLYVERNKVTAVWFIPNELLIYGLGEKEQQIVMKNMEKQLTELKLCKLEELVASEGDREIREDLYLEYFRKNQFLKALLPKELKKSNAISAKGEE
ncbi:hypothetical protein SRCM100730_04007 [Bacillus velezensis]|uniref:hypothetical protein n=1 Tax=Bacillus velezensis TaxID=492670 RepID=UPI0007F8E5C8|nr:hypothetical protein [Bacillus velezensis]MEC0446173.1 hypothetical protein [Bacillus velezensis]OBR31532.1 hypothetical protein SRCM100731_02751 [Bacillus velezensis]OCB92351.1 hypothetical protein SRCM100730_04007 [Bacillus velezensis]